MMHVILISLSRRLWAVFGRHDCERNMSSPVGPAGPAVSEWCYRESRRLIMSHCLSARGRLEKSQQRETISLESVVLGIISLLSGLDCAQASQFPHKSFQQFTEKWGEMVAAELFSWHWIQPLLSLTSGFAYLLGAFCVRLAQTVQMASLPTGFE